MMYTAVSPIGTVNSYDRAFVQQSLTPSLDESPASATLSKTTTNLSSMSFVQPPNILPLHQYCSQLFNNAMVERLQSTHHVEPMPEICPNYRSVAAASLLDSFDFRSALSMPMFNNRFFHVEEPRPQQSYIGLIAIAILNSPELKLVLSDIYQYILEKYPYFRTRGPGWRNSIRHNLSLNDCFIKFGRSKNGKGHFWAIHPANQEDFRNGDFRRRQAQRKVQKYMGCLSADDAIDLPRPLSSSISPTSFRVEPQWMSMMESQRASFQPVITANPDNIPIDWLDLQTAQGKIDSQKLPRFHQFDSQPHIIPTTNKVLNGVIHQSSPRKRQFDIASLLGPENREIDESLHRENIEDTHNDITQINEERESYFRNIFDQENYYRQSRIRVCVEDI